MKTYSGMIIAIVGALIALVGFFVPFYWFSTAPGPSEWEQAISPLTYVIYVFNPFNDAGFIPFGLLAIFFSWIILLVTFSPLLLIIQTEEGYRFSTICKRAGIVGIITICGMFLNVLIIRMFTPGFHFLQLLSGPGLWLLLIGFCGIYYGNMLLEKHQRGQGILSKGAGKNAQGELFVKQRIPQSYVSHSNSSPGYQLQEERGSYDAILPVEEYEKPHASYPHPTSSQQ